MINPIERVHRSRFSQGRTLSLLAAFALVGCMNVEPTAPRSIAPGALSMHAGPSPHVDVYVHAHEDDWQLFMGDRVAASIASAGPNDKVVLVYTTAGDGGRGTAFWTAREGASKASADTLIGSGAWTCARQTVLGHSIQRCTKGRVVEYYMRMPDGNWGEGFGFGSLELLQGGRPTSAIDGSTTYSTWADFTNTLRQIIVDETGGLSSPNVQVGGPEYDRVLNQGDHLDHLTTADAVRAATQGSTWDLAWYIGYRTQNLPQNVSGDALNRKLAEFWRYTQYMGDAGYGSAWGESMYQAWVRRTYVREVPYIPPAPPEAPTNLAVTSTTWKAVTLQWTDNSTLETLFRIERAPDVGGVAGTFAIVGTVGANVVNFTDTNLPATTRYWYRVRAEGNAGPSGYTAQVSATTIALPSAPSAPTNFQGVGASGSRIDLTWTDAATNEEMYQLERAADVSGVAGTYALIATLAANTTSYSDNGLQPNTRYWYRLRAVNDGGNSAYGVASPSTSNSFDVDVFVQPYEDDWQLFMGDRVYASLQSSQRVVFVYTTTGDQGQNTAFWTARENQSKASVDTLVGPGAWTCAPRTISGHAIQRCEKGKVVAYYMRMPDGFWGDGFGHGSLELLQSGQATSALDNSTRYTNWNDFTTTVRALIVGETGNQAAPYAKVHSFDYSRTSNPNDMPDRYATADAVNAASSGQGWSISWYVGKNVANLTANVTGAPYDIKVAAFRAADAIMIRGGYGSSWWEVQNLLPKTYFRTVIAP